jgi:hypothetical protein
MEKNVLVDLDWLNYMADAILRRMFLELSSE